MKILVGLLASAVLSFGMNAMPESENEGNKSVSILQDSDLQGVIEEAVAPPVATEEFGIIEAPVAVQSESITGAPSVLVDDVYLNGPVMEYQMVEAPFVVDSPVMYEAPAVVECQTCCKRRCCCPPPRPIPTTFCLVDPCGCSHEACVDVPACCAGEQPVICWKQGLLRRQIATLCWECCDHEVKVIVTGRGKVRVRD